jgi:predicted alpha/beta hydrolase
VISDERVEFPARDGLVLGGTLFRPASPAGRALQIQAAAGVPQQYYARFAAFLAERGFTVLSFDYRGIGLSRPARLRGMRARMCDWPLLDAAGALDFLERVAPGERLMIVGHSIGGVSTALLPQAARLAAVLMVGAQSGYWRNWPPLRRPWIWLAVHVAIPLLARLVGFFPSSRIGFGEDLPKGVALEWARWCRHPRYLAGALGAGEAFARFAAPLRSYVADDDAFAPPRAAAALLELYFGARAELRAVSPRDVGVDRIGHFGFFRERFRDTLWREAADWLARQ